MSINASRNRATREAKDSMAAFEVKDSGKRETYDSGMVRDTDEGKVRYDLALDGPMFDRWAEHLTKGAKKYKPRNWMKASGQEELERFRQSALRHFLQWYRGEVDEDHASAVFFNINGAEYCNDGGAGDTPERVVLNAITPETPKLRLTNGTKEKPYRLVDSCKPGDFYRSPSGVLYQKMMGDGGWYNCDSHDYQLKITHEHISPASKSEARRIAIQLGYRDWDRE